MENDETKFEAYFSGEMNSEQANDFNTALENSEELRNDFDYFLAIKKSASLIEQDKMRAELFSIDVGSESPSEKTTEESSLRLIPLIKWAAGIAAILLISFFAYSSFNTLSPQDLYADNFETYEVQASRGGDIDALKRIYTEGNYDMFIDEALDADESPEINMMLANAYLNSNQYSEAIKTLTKISDDSSLRDQKYWYLGLTYLKIGDIEASSKNFKTLLLISNYKKAATEEILSSISK